MQYMLGKMLPNYATPMARLQQNGAEISNLGVEIPPEVAETIH